MYFSDYTRRHVSTKVSCSGFLIPQNVNNSKNYISWCPQFKILVRQFISSQRWCYALRNENLTQQRNVLRQMMWILFRPFQGKQLSKTFSTSIRLWNTTTYRGADKSLARPGRKQSTATEDFEFHTSYL